MMSNMIVELGTHSFNIAQARLSCQYERSLGVLGAVM